MGKQVGYREECLAYNKQGILGIAYFYYVRSEPSLQTKSASSQAHVLSTPPVSQVPPKCTVDYMAEQMTNPMEAENMAGLWLGEWGAR